MEVDDQPKTTDEKLVKNTSVKEKPLCNGNGTTNNTEMDSDGAKSGDNTPEKSDDPQLQKKNGSCSEKDTVKNEKEATESTDSKDAQGRDRKDSDENEINDDDSSRKSEVNQDETKKSNESEKEAINKAESESQKEKVENETKIFKEGKQGHKNETDNIRSDTPSNNSRADTPCNDSQTPTPVNATSSSRTSTPVNVKPSSPTSTPVNVKPASRTSTPVNVKPASRTSTPVNVKSASRTSTPVNAKAASRTATPVDGKSSSRTATPVSSTSNSSISLVTASTSNEKTKGSKLVPVKKKDAPKKSKVTRMLDQSGPAENFRPIAQLLFDIGMDVTRQTVYKDLIRIQRKKESLGKLDEKEKVQLEKLGVAYTDLILKNETFLNDQTGCNHCGFKSDSSNIMTCHMEFAHDQHLNVFTCVLCSAVLHSAAQFLYHMESSHNRRGRIYMKHAFFVCPNCPYESNNNSQFKKHTDKCTKVFNPRHNLMPLAPDKDIPLMAPRPPAPKQPPVPKAPPKPKAAPRPVVPPVPRFVTRPPSQSPIPRPVIHMGPSARAHFGQSILGPRTRQPVSSMSVRPGSVPKPSQMTRGPVPASRPTIATPPRSATPAASGSESAALVQMNGQFYKLAMVGTQQFLVPVSDPNVIQASSGQSRPKVVGSNSQSAVKVTSSPATQGAVPNNTSNREYEVCEICGGFVKDREALRIHFIWAHKVHIHKDVFKSKKPPLVCPQCKGSDMRFWTNQGLNKHRQEGHKSVPKSIRSTNAPRLIDQIVKKCIYCLEQFPVHISAKQFWDHMGIHGISPASIFRTNKCCACGVRIIDAKLMNSHLRAKHDLLFAKGTFTKEVPSPVQPGQSQTPKPSASMNDKFKQCPFCSYSSMDVAVLNRHTLSAHPFRCSRCTQRFDDIDGMHQHFNSKHSQEKDECPICKDKIKIGRSYIRHMKSEHMKGCSVIVQRIAKSILDARREEVHKVLQTIAESKQKTPNKRKRETPQKKEQDKVIVLDEDSPPRKKKYVDSSKAKNGKEVLEVDGEEIVVELQDDDEEESELTIKIASSESLSENQNVPNGDVQQGKEDEMNLKITSSSSLCDKTGLDTVECEKKNIDESPEKTKNADMSVEYISSDTGSEQKEKTEKKNDICSAKKSDQNEIEMDTS